MSVLAPVVILGLFASLIQAGYRYGHEKPWLNLISNWDYEENTDYQTNYLRHARGTRDPRANTGSYSYRVFNRQDGRGSLYHEIPGEQLKPDTNYYLSFFFYLLNNASREYTRVRSSYKFFFKDGTSLMDYSGVLPHQVADGNWRHVGGDFKTPSRSLEYLVVHLRVEPESVDFLVDTASLTKIRPMQDWKQTLMAKIKRRRMGNITLNLRLGPIFKKGVTTVEIEHKKHDFLLGSAVPAFAFLRDTKLKDFITQHFNWIGFISNFLWDDLEKDKGKIDYSVIDKAIALANKHGLKVRAHALLWNRYENTPTWARALTGRALENEIMRRITYSTEHFKGKLVQWEVSNEQLHHRFYEKSTGDHDIHYKEFLKAREHDANVSLVTNDYELLRTGRYTSAAVDMALTLMRRGAPVGGIGAQSHLREIPMDPEVMVKRIQMMGAAGLPVLASELSVHSRDENLKADQLEKVLMAYFSERHVIGIMLWGFSDQSTLLFDPDAVLTRGPNFIPNKAGKRMLNLIHNVWTTKLNIPVSNRGESHTFRGYYGTYELRVLVKNQLCHRETFIVRSGTNPTININRQKLII